MPRTSPALEDGAATGAFCVGVDVAEIGERVVERLTGTTARLTMTGVSFGLGLTTPVKAMFPKVWGTKGAWAAEGAATVTASATGAVVVALMMGVAAEAGRAREATMPPEMTITAEAFLAGKAVREMADEKEVDTELKGLGARWRPEIWLDTVKNLSRRLRGQLSGSGWRLHPAFTPADRLKSSTTERASPQGASLDAPDLGPPLLPSGC